MTDDVAPQVAQLIAERRDVVASTAMRELQQADVQELPDLLHRLAGKLGVFGHAAAGDAARSLLLDLRSGGPVRDVQASVAAIVALLTSRGSAA